MAPGNNEADAARELLIVGRDTIRKLLDLSGGDPQELARDLKEMLEADQGPAVAGALYAALLDGGAVAGPRGEATRFFLEKMVP